MPSLPWLPLPRDAAQRWLWLALSIVPDVLLVAGLLWLWAFLRRTRRMNQQMLAEARGDLARRTETLRWATELADVGVWFWDLVSGELEWTDRCKAHFGLPPGRSPSVEYFFSVIHPEDRERVRAAIDRSLAVREDYRTVFRVMHPDGSQRWMAAMGHAQYDAAGTSTSMGGVSIDVTKLRTIEDQVRSLQSLTHEQAAELDLARRFRIFAENASDVVMETDNGGAIRWITPSVKTRLGRDPAALVGRDFAQLVHPDDWDRLRATESQAARGSPADAELRLRIADDGYQWFSVSLRPLFDDHHTVIGRVAGWRDIHQEMQAREAVAVERHRLRATLEGMLDPLVMLQPVRSGEDRIVDFTYVDANPAACDWIGVERDHLLGTQLLRRFPQVESTGLLEKYRELADSGRPLVIDDFPFPLHETALRRMDIRGMRVDGLISLVWRDVTERHVAAQRIAASEVRFRLLAENALDVVMLIDVNDKLLWVSPAIKPVLGWATDTCIGRSGADFVATDESRQRYLEAQSRVLAGQGVVTRLQLRDAAGAAHWAEIHASGFRTAEGRIEGIVMTTRVIDAEVRIEQALENRARTDDLTQLLNRNELLSRLGVFLEHGERHIAVLWCDIDHFKAINDAHGHAVGDAVLRTMGERIRGCLRTSDDIGARVGGDELLVVLHDVHGVEDACEVAERLRRLAAEPIAVDGGTVEATLSIGVAVARPNDGVDALLARADDAMYEAKARGRDQVMAIPEPTRPHERRRLPAPG